MVEHNCEYNCEYHVAGHSDYYVSVRKDAKAARRRFLERGWANLGDVHLIARLHLGLLDDPHVHCAHCGVPDCHTTAIQAALNWPEVSTGHLRKDARGNIFSIAPEIDYIALCIPCHRRLDSWRRALAPAAVIAMGRSRPAWNPEEL